MRKILHLSPGSDVREDLVTDVNDSNRTVSVSFIMSSQLIDLRLVFLGYPHGNVSETPGEQETGLVKVEKAIHEIDLVAAVIQLEQKRRVVLQNRLWKTFPDWSDDSEGPSLVELEGELTRANPDHVGDFENAFKANTLLPSSSIVTLATFGAITNATDRLYVICVESDFIAVYSEKAGGVSEL